ncbi:MAG TPA: NAD-dependent protein deacylase [Longimicrobiales bacterium]|nr:NAD-dependent protein deacylase [Longimicrobiales bacterium]
MTEGLARARELLARARAVVVLTGAGVSAESGVPTFRGAGGLWRAHRPEELATPEAFARDPVTVWEWYAWRREVVAGCAPNEAHLALARLALRGRPRATLVTQNVDGLHHRAADAVARELGAPPEGAYPIEVHGALHRDRCSGCGRRTPAPARVDMSAPENLPRCERCGALLRPDVVWFGEALDPATVEAAFAAARAADLCLVVGTSAVVHPAAQIPEVTLRSGGAVIEVNPEPTPLSVRATVSLSGPAGALLPALLG